MGLKPLVVGIDGSDNGQDACRFAAELAVASGAAVVAVHVFEPLHWLGRVAPPVDFHSLKETVAARLDAEWCAPLRDAGVAFSARVVEGSPTEALAAVADEVDAALVVVGVRGQTIVRELVSGSTALELPHAARRPVVLVPPAA